MKNGKAENAEEGLLGLFIAREFGFPLRIETLLFSALQGLLNECGRKLSHPSQVRKKKSTKQLTGIIFCRTDKIAEK